ncbi:MAG TPA: hypothetical protein VF895_04610 [Gaiellaceae bacterium]
MLRTLALIALVLLASASAAAASAGNGKIAFVRNGDIWTVDPDGSSLTNLTQGSAGEVVGSPVWSPDGSLLAAATAAPTPGPIPFVVRSDGSGVVHFPANGQVVCWLTPDRILLERDFRNPGVVTEDLFAVQADGTGLQALTNDGGQKYVTAQACAPDGSKVAYSRASGSVAQAYSVSTAGGASGLLTPAGFSDFAPAVAPDSRHAAIFRSSTFGAGIFVIDLADGSTVKLSDSIPNSALLWSPDGSKLVFGTQRSLGYVDRYTQLIDYDVHLLATDGSADRDLTSTRAADTQPSWSPDGTRILFFSNRGSAGNLWVMNPDGTCQTPVADVGSAASVGWQPLPDAPPAPPVECADLAVTAVGNGPAVAFGGIVYYTFTVTNHGNQTATDVMLEGVQPPEHVQGATVQASQGSCALANPITCDLGALGPGADAQVLVKMESTLAPPGEGPTGLVYGMTASSPEPDPDGTNNSGSATVLAYPCNQVGGDGPDLLYGTPQDDTLCGLKGPDRILGRGGNDVLEGGPGFDWIDGGSGRDAITGGGENDTVLATDGERDTIDCGGSNEDLAVVDRMDEVTDCERVVHSPLLCKKIGTWYANDMVGTPGTDIMCGLPGGDKINGLAGNDAIDGGQGNDTLIGGTGRDRLIGGAGYDVILARDGEVDRIECGRDYDIVVADRLDRVASDCEKVLRNLRSLP